MAKIDVSKISGFDGMTDEEKVKALLGFEIPDAVDMSGYVTKERFDAKASEAAKLSKQLKEKMTDDEAAKAAEAERQSELEEKYNALLKKSTIAEYKSKYLAQGYDEKLAEDTAAALFDGNAEKVFANGEKFRSAMEQKIKADILRETPRPDAAGSGSKTITKEQFAAMGYSERNKLFMENKELYNELTKEN